MATGMEDDTLRELAKASLSISKVAGKAIDAVRECGEWLNKVFGRPIVNTVDLCWTDRVETRRIRAAIYDYRNLALLLADVKSELALGGVTKTKSLPPKVALPLLESATMENEARLRKLWAHLLASELAGEKIERTYVKALQELTGRDATILSNMYIEWMRGRFLRRTSRRARLVTRAELIAKQTPFEPFISCFRSVW